MSDLSERIEALDRENRAKATAAFKRLLVNAGKVALIAAALVGVVVGVLSVLV